MSIFGLPSKFRLHFPAQSRSFAKKENMENGTKNAALARQYEAFASLLLEGQVYFDASLGFREICSWIGADPDALGGMIREELGLGGEELLRDLRESGRRFLRRKYAPDAQKLL